MGCSTGFETEMPGLRGQITTSKFMCQALAVCHNFSSDKGLAKRQPFSPCHDYNSAIIHLKLLSQFG